MPWNWTKPLMLALVAATAAGCATNKEELLTHGGRSMHDIWRQEAGDGGSGGNVAGRQLLDARQSLRRPLTEADEQASAAQQARYTRTAANEIQRQFHRLPNPDLVMYVFPTWRAAIRFRCRVTRRFFRCTSACNTPCPANGWRTTDGLVIALAQEPRCPCCIFCLR